MTDDSSPAQLTGLASVWADLTAQHYALTNDQLIGLPNNFRKTVLRRYFNDQTLRHDEGDRPVDRKRARDVVGYQWRDGRLHLREHETITLTDRAGIPGKREHARVWLLDDREAEQFVCTCLSLVPPNRRRGDGTFGINLFRTFTNVVTKPHHDDEEYVILYVLDRIGDGAESYLYRPDDVTDPGQPTAEPVYRHQLDPGEIIIFEDNFFRHGATPLIPPSEGTAQRDVLICTVDYRETFLRHRPPRGDESTNTAKAAPRRR